MNSYSHQPFRRYHPSPLIHGHFPGGFTRQMARISSHPHGQRCVRAPLGYGRRAQTPPYSLILWAFQALSLCNKRWQRICAETSSTDTRGGPITRRPATRPYKFSASASLPCRIRRVPSQLAQNARRLSGASPDLSRVTLSQNRPLRIQCVGTMRPARLFSLSHISRPSGGLPVL